MASGDAWLALKYAQNINPNKKMLGVILNSDNKDITLEHYNTVDKYKEELKEVVLG